MNTSQILFGFIPESRLVGVSIGTLRFWRIEGKGPRLRKVGRLVGYSPSDINEWLNRRPTGSEAPEVAR